MRQSASENGFTLIETLIAVFALSLLMGAGGTLLISTLDSNRVAQERVARLNNLEIATAHLRADLSDAIPRVARSDRANEDGKSFYGGFPDRNDVVLGLIRTGRTNIENEADRSELLAVEYSFTNGQLIRRVHQSPDRARRTPAFETVLIEGLSDIEVRFSAGGTNAARWGLIVEDSRPVLPEAVMIEMDFENGERLIQSFLVGGAI